MGGLQIFRYRGTMRLQHGGEWMSGDVVQRTVMLSAGALNEDKVLSWLASLVRELRRTFEVPIGTAGTLLVSSDSGTVEIDPRTKRPVAANTSRSLGFTASDALLSVVKGGVLNDERLARLEGPDAIGSLFAKALAAELVENRRAAIGNFGVWTIGRLPDLTVFVRFRSRPAINRMLA